MTAKVFTPKLIAQALGVSESSVKRWVDSGRLLAAKTAGGHRKVALPSLIQFVRETGHQVVEPSLVGLVTVSRGMSIEDARDPLFSQLITGHETACREMFLRFYQRGESLTAIGDRLIGPLLQRIGDGWADGTVQVHQERRACEIIIAMLHELRRLLPPAPSRAPLAIVATPLRDFAGVPSRLVELVLLDAGWRVVVAGSGLPLEEIRDSVLKHQPQLVCLSVTHLEDPSDFISQCNRVLMRSLRNPPAGLPPRLVVGGSALNDQDVTGLECDLFAMTLADLVSYQATLPRAAS